MTNTVITLALSLMADALKKKRGKVFKFLIDPKTQNTIGDFYASYITMVATLEDDEDE